jgi:hypothetical protein
MAPTLIIHGDYFAYLFCNHNKTQRARGRGRHAETHQKSRTSHEPTSLHQPAAAPHQRPATASQPGEFLPSWRGSAVRAAFSSALSLPVCLGPRAQHRLRLAAADLEELGRCQFFFLFPVKGGLRLRASGTTTAFSPESDVRATNCWTPLVMAACSWKNFILYGGSIQLQLILY